jgi:hypothetical protein
VRKGRLSNANLPAHAARPMILPDKHYVTRIVIREQHVCVGHMGIEATLANIRQKYSVIKGRQTVKAVLRDCMFCRKMHSKLLIQKMADLLRQRFKYQEPPFSSTGVDYFGSIEVKIGKCMQVLGMSLHMPKLSRCIFGGCYFPKCFGLY